MTKEEIIAKLEELQKNYQRYGDGHHCDSFCGRRDGDFIDGAEYAYDDIAYELKTLLKKIKEK